MRRKRAFCPCLSLICLLVLGVMHGVAGADTAKGPAAHHELTISLFPEESKLEGRDRIRIQRPEKGPVELFLSPRARIQAVRVDGNDHPYTFTKGRVTLTPDRSEAILGVDLSIHYVCRFDDPVPLRPVNTDNPGFGVSGTISPRGTFILSGAGWYPRIAGSRETFSLRVDGPGGMAAVTGGRMLEIKHRGKRTVSHWHIDNPLEGLNLSAGPYVVDRQRVNGITAATYLFAENRGLSPRYLAASIGYLKRYSELFGAYPFDGFAVVENFFPTGYGFPGYTLMGGAVLRLPFIPETSLAHEIVHNWWGNGVLVDFTSGNWCEGLTSYSADYLNRELASSDAAVDYRRQAMRNYSSLVSETTDFPLSRFRSRTDTVTRAVGYDKSAMVFHMVRREVGDAAFWAALRDLYRNFLFKRASWKDLQQHFEQRTGRSLSGFFRQWIERPGAPRMRLEDVRLVSDDNGYRATGRLVQEKPFYDLRLELVLDTGFGSVGQTVHLKGRHTEFALPSSTRPLRITADPGYHLFRRLTPEEMPPSVNTLKGSKSIVLVIANRMGRSGSPLARRFTRAMAVTPIRTVRETGFSPADANGSDLLLVGLPDKTKLVQLLPRSLELTPGSFQLAGQRFDQSADVLFFVARIPDHPERIVALLHPLAPDAADQAILKIPHYSRYSYLAFRNGRNRAKGTWDINDSPLMVRWAPRTAPDQRAGTCPE